MAERTNFKAYCVYSAAISLVVYPICGPLDVGRRLAAEHGLRDFAGSQQSTMGGVIALLGAWMLGPALRQERQASRHSGHNLTAGALGVFILCSAGSPMAALLSLATDEAMTMTGLVWFNTNPHSASHL